MGSTIGKNILKTKVKNDIIYIWTKCQVCNRFRWFVYEQRRGYICLKCSEIKRHYWYIKCDRCGRAFYAHTHMSKRCIQCCYCLRRPRRRQAAIRTDGLMDGELFFCLEFPDTVFMKYKGKTIYHGGKKNYINKIVRETVNLYKYYPKY